ncbi:MAG: hypothetical protein JO053_11265 [Acidobacteria bacterium]|nr:hypothetical protein [Acidobacteriota bacterium]
MKKRTIIFILLLFKVAANSQTDSDRAEWAYTAFGGVQRSTAAEQKRILQYNFGPLWARLTDNTTVLGYIGDDFQRMRLVILSASKQPGHLDTYNVTGKSMVNGVVRSFTGTITITRTGTIPIEDDYKFAGVRRAGIAFGEYHFSEDKRLSNTGEFNGKFLTNWIVTRNGVLKYDEVMAGADGYRNNQFAGTWTSYKTKTTKPASWGDSRIPISMGLDVGDGEFSPCEECIARGWKNYHDAYFKQDKRAMIVESRRWWR